MRRAALKIYRTLGSGLSESVYQNALCIEMQKGSYMLTKEEIRLITYEGHAVGHHRHDIVLGHAVIEIKASKQGVHFSAKPHLSQIQRYYRFKKPDEIVILVGFCDGCPYTEMWE